MLESGRHRQLRSPLFFFEERGGFSSYHRRSSVSRGFCSANKADCGERLEVERTLFDSGARSTVHVIPFDIPVQAASPRRSCNVRHCLRVKLRGRTWGAAFLCVPNSCFPELGNLSPVRDRWLVAGSTVISNLAAIFELFSLAR